MAMKRHIRKRLLSFLQHMVLWLKDFLIQKHGPGKSEVSLKKNKIVLIRMYLETGCISLYSGAKVPSCFYPVDLATHMGDPGDSFCIRETPRLSGRVGMHAICESPVYVTCPFL